MSHLLLGLLAYIIVRWVFLSEFDSWDWLDCKMGLNFAMFGLLGFMSAIAMLVEYIIGGVGWYNIKQRNLKWSKLFGRAHPIK